MDVSAYQPRRRKWPLLLGGFFALLVLLYFVVTSGAFLRAVVVPRIAAALHSELVVEEISLSPFSSLTLRGLKLTPKGAETLATVTEVRVRYGLLAILGGTIKVDEVTVVSPVVTVVGKADGTSNLSQLLAALAKDSPPAPPKPAGAPPKVELRNVSLKNGTLRQTSVTTNGTAVVELTGLNLALDQLANGGTGQLTLASGLAVTQGGTNTLAAKTDGSFKLGVDDKLLPREINGALNLMVTGATGAFREFAQTGTKLTVDSTGSEIREVRLAVTRGGQPAGELLLKGPFDLDKQEARISYSLKGIDRTALGLVAAAAGVDLGQTSLAAEGRIDLADRGQLFASQGQLAVNRLSVAAGTAATPVLDVTLDYKLQVNLETKTALIEKADLAVQQGAAKIVSGALDRPMNIAWDAAAPGFREATYTLSVKQLDLAGWRAVAGPSLPTGLVNLDAGVTSDRDGRMLKFTANAALSQVAVTVGDQTIRDLALTLKAAGSVEDFKVYTLDQAAGEARQGGQALGQFTAAVRANLRDNDLGGQLSVEAQLPAALRTYPVEGLSLSAGLAKLTAQFSTKNGQTNSSAALALTGLAGDVFGAKLSDYEARFEATAGLAAGKAQLQRGTLTLRSGTDAGGSLDATGTYDLATRKGDLDFKTANLNEKALGPFLASAIKPNELRSVSLDLTGKAQVDLAGESTLRTALKLSRLVVRDPAGRLPERPLEFGINLDAGQRAQRLDLRQLAVTLPPTTRARNELRATGTLDFATNNAAPSTLNLTSDGLDFTPLYDLFAGDGSAKPAGAPAEPSATQPAKPGEPIKLPLERFTLDAKLAAVFLREVAVSNFVAKVELNRGKVAVDPFSLSLNGAPVSAKALLDLGVPGYTYDLAANLQAVPLPPLAKSFMTGELVDLHGTLDGKLALKGAGVDGAGFRQHLAGNVEFAATNLDYKITALKTPLMKTLVTTLTAALSVPSLDKSPLDGIAARMEANQGVVNLASARVSSAVFMADAQGKIQLADGITNSPINIPVTVSLPKDGKMAALPTFLTLKGTLGAPKPDIDPVALGRALTQLPGAAGGLINKGVDQLGGALDKALGGKGGTNAGSASSLLKGFLGSPAPATNAPAAGTTNTNAAPAPFNPLDLFKKKPTPK